jgi:lactate dehydrogenase-like 2-hydroxyacid dehydrogenase
MGRKSTVRIGRVRQRETSNGMKVTIIGAGNMGRAIGTRAVAGGHEVEISLGRSLRLSRLRF